MLHRKAPSIGPIIQVYVTSAYIYILWRTSGDDGDHNVLDSNNYWLDEHNYYILAMFNYSCHVQQYFLTGLEP